MKLEKIFSYRKKVGRILGYSLIVFLLAIIGIELGYKFARKPFYFYNHRYDVVLTDSMSVKNEKYEEFLDGTKQIQAFDFVVSEKITDKTKLNVLDVVIFDNPDIGIDMHRIVDIDYVGDNVKLKNLSQEAVGSVETFKFVSPSSCVELENEFIYTDFEIVIYTKEAFDEKEYYFNVNTSSVKPEVTSTQESNGYYKNIITYHRNSASPAKFSITKQSYEYKANFEYVKLSGGKEEIIIDKEALNNAKDETYSFNVKERYLIRGDKANTDDGWYERSKLQAKVTDVLPKFGYPVRFLSSPYGTILLVGLMLIPIAYWFFFDKKNKKEEVKKDEK